MNLMNWRFMNFKMDVPTETHLFTVKNALRERHGRVKDLVVCAAPARSWRCFVRREDDDARIPTLPKSSKTNFVSSNRVGAVERGRARRDAAPPQARTASRRRTNYETT